ncbi:hypothetical protein PX554_10835 [Sphingomonas sp. H39-1-10]|uniref:hypothetical protein n=1 Tax=Sphingomonas TaxID=13687 RepID=UPI00088B186F|nr:MULTISPECIES: hypothetical protein [Sphingomonas]MDF0488626.1 hypothetical protein [Sphingomonas pollutisoli]SDA12342.1 hypothetical protein SAMN03159340_00266 [Sphingomonas sp. NFR15]
MQPFDKRDRHALLETWRGSWKFLMFGIAVLAYLVAIERPQWFVLRPATGTAIALASAAEAAPAKKGAIDPAKP